MTPTPAEGAGEGDYVALDLGGEDRRDFAAGVADEQRLRLAEVQNALQAQLRRENRGDVVFKIITTLYALAYLAWFGFAAEVLMETQGSDFFRAAPVICPAPGSSARLRKALLTVVSSEAAILFVACVTWFSGNIGCHRGREEPTDHPLTVHVVEHQVWGLQASFCAVAMTRENQTSSWMLWSKKCHHLCWIRQARCLGPAGCLIVRTKGIKNHTSMFHNNHASARWRATRDADFCQPQGQSYDGRRDGHRFVLLGLAGGGNRPAS
jgi:hypothetical protein